MAELYYDPYDFEIDADPHPIWRRMRDEAPLYRARCPRSDPHAPFVFPSSASATSAARPHANAGVADTKRRDPNAPAWDEWVQKGYVTAPKEVETEEKEEGSVLDVRESVSPDEHRVPVVLRDPYHQPHLQNFFDAVRGKAKLNCPAEVGYESAVTVLKVNEAIEAISDISG